MCLSVLDQSPVRRGSTVAQALQETVQLAQRVGSTPKVLIAHLAGETQHIRVGSGGVMMPNHSTLKVTGYEVDEIIAVTLTQDFADRVRSYELLAEAFELPQPDGIASKA